MPEFDLSIITVGFKSREFVRGLLESLMAARANLKIEYFIIDNASNDGLLEMVKKEFEPRADVNLQFRLIQNEANLGFAKANNLGIKAARGRYVLLLNPDMRLFPDTLTNMIKWMDAHPQAGIAGCKLVNESGKVLPHVRRFPTVWDQALILLKVPHWWPSVLNHYLVTDYSYERDARIDSLRGSFFMIRPRVIEEIGGLDERYFIWFEEVDYCRAATAAGIQIWCTSSARCIDFVGRSFSLVGGLQKQKYFTDSMLKYFRKWQPNSAWVIAALRPLALAAAWLGEKIKK